MIDVHLDGLLDSGIYGYVTFHGFRRDALMQFRLDTDIEQAAVFFFGTLSDFLAKAR